MNNKQIQDLFSNSLNIKFETYCKRHDMKNDTCNFITYLIDNDLIRPSTVKHYAVIEAFDRVYEKNGNKKSLAVDQISDRFRLSSRTIWSILKKRNICL